MREYRNISVRLCVRLIFLFGCANEKREIYYATLAEATEIQRGWLPPILPPSARDIYEQHYIDMSLVWVKFISNKEDLFILLKHLTRLNSQEIRSLGDEIYGVPEWWPDMLTESHFKKAQDDFPFVIARYDYIIDYGNNRKESKYGHFFLNFTTGEAYYFGGKNTR